MSDSREKRLRGYPVRQHLACKIVIESDPYSRTIEILAQFTAGIAANFMRNLVLVFSCPSCCCDSAATRNWQMAEEGSAEAAIALKKSLWWVNEEVDRLAIKWIAVSTEPGGPGTGQRLDGLWKKITYRFLNDVPLPPTPKDKRGKECLPRNIVSLTSKWKRTRLMVAKYMKGHMLAISNPLSGENAEGVIKRSMKAYKDDEGHDFAHLTTYDILKDEPKWHLDVAQLRDTVQQQTGAAEQTVRQRLERETEREPTVARTGKPKGVKKARRTTAEMSAKEKEICKEEQSLSKYLDALTQKGRLGISTMLEGSKRTQVMQDALDHDIMKTDTTGMDAVTRVYYELRKKHVVARLLAFDTQTEQDRIAAELGTSAGVAGDGSGSRTQTGTEEEEQDEEQDEEQEEEQEDADHAVDDEEDLRDGHNGTDDEFWENAREE